MSSNNTDPDPNGMKGGVIDLARSTHEQDAADDDTEDSPWPTAAPLSFSRWPSSNRPANNDPLPDFKDQVRTVQPLPPQQGGSGKTQPAAGPAFKQEEEDDSSEDGVHQASPQQELQQEPLAPSPGGNGQEGTAIAFAQGIPISSAVQQDLAGGGRGDGGRIPNDQTTVIRKHMIWAAVVFGTVVVVVVAVVVVTLTLNSSRGGGEGPTPPSANPAAPPFPPPPITLTAQPAVAPSVAPITTAPSPTANPVMVAPPTTTTNSPSSTKAPNTLLPSTGSPSTTATTAVPQLFETKLTANDGAALDHFGRSVAIAEDDTIVVGSWQDDTTDNGFESGSAYVYTRSSSSTGTTTTTTTTWTLQAKLTANDGEAFDQFGVSLAIDSDTIVVGANGDDDSGSNSGSANVFTRTAATTWTQQAKLMPSDAAAGDRFGRSVAIDGDTIVVGANFGDNDSGQNSGSAFVFTRTGTTWTQQAKLMASDGTALDEFGRSVAIAGDTIVVGAYFADNENGSESGSAFVFTRTGSTWTEQTKLTASDGAAQDRFGGGVAIDGDTIVVGAEFSDSSSGSNSGSAYVFTLTGTTWTQQAKLTVDDGAADDRFGTSVAIDGDTIIVGATRNDVDGITDSGSAYVFTRTGSTWTLQTKLAATDGATDDEFGNSVDVSGNTIVVGASLTDSESGTDSGSTYTYDLNLL